MPLGVWNYWLPRPDGTGMDCSMLGPHGDVPAALDWRATHGEGRPSKRFKKRQGLPAAIGFHGALPNQHPTTLSFAMLYSGS